MSNMNCVLWPKDNKKCDKYITIHQNIGRHKCMLTIQQIGELLQL